MNYYDDDFNYFWHPWKKSERLQSNRIFVEGRGCYVTSLEGNRYLDAASGALNVSCGYSQREIIEAMLAQAESLATADAARFSSLPPIRLAKKMAELFQYKLTKTFFCTSGSEATESAIKMARLYTLHKYGMERQNVISFKGGYHGSTSLPLSASHAEYIQAENGPLAIGFHSIETPQCIHCLNFEDHDQCQLPDPQQLQDKILELGPDTVSAFIMEPVMGIGGFIMPSREYVEELFNICRRLGILFILDETMTSFGRTGKWFAFEHFRIAPDILVSGKGICSGYSPLSAVSTTEEVFRTVSMDKYLGGFRHGHTNSGHATGCAIALAVIQYMEKYQLINNSEDMGLYLLDSLREKLAPFSFIRSLRGLGLIVAFNLQDSARGEEFTQECFELGLIIRQTGSSIGLLPPLILSKKEADEIVTKLTNACIQYAKKLEGGHVFANNY